MHGFKITIGLEMPTERPDDVNLCDECHMKHGPKDDCWEGILPGGKLPLPALDKYDTGREMVDHGMDKMPEKDLSSEKSHEEGLMSQLKSGAVKMAKNVKKGKKNGS